jgi:hypothetical protein
MEATTARGPSDVGWTSVGACTLPTPERPLRLAEFDDLFATTLQSIERDGGTHARLFLAADDALTDRVQRLAEAESSCCSFFSFSVSRPEGGLVALGVTVPPAYADVLDGLVARAKAVRGEVS